MAGSGQVAGNEPLPKRRVILVNVVSSIDHVGIAPLPLVETAFLPTMER